MAKNNFKKEIERKRKADPVTLRKHFATFEEALSALRKADEGINYAEKKTNKFFNIIRKFINKIKSIFIK